MNYQQNINQSIVAYCIIQLLFFTWLSGSLLAQDSEINLVISNYLRVKEAQLQEKLFTCDFRYQPGSLKFPNVIEYKRQEKFYYAFREGTNPVLEMAVLQIDSGKIHYDIELVYDAKGNLIFCQESQNNPNFKYNQIKIYFKEEELLRFMEGNAIITSSLVFHREKIEFIQKTAKTLHKKFIDYARSLRLKP